MTAHHVLHLWFVPLIAARALERPLGWGTFWLKVGGLVLAAIPLLGNAASVMFTFYPPSRRTEHFYVGPTLVVAGTWLVTLNLALTLRRGAPGTPRQVLESVELGRRPVHGSRRVRSGLDQGGHEPGQPVRRDAPCQRETEVGIVGEDVLRTGRRRLGEKRATAIESVHPAPDHTAAEGRTLPGLEAAPTAGTARRRCRGGASASRLA